MPSTRYHYTSTEIAPEISASGRILASGAYVPHGPGVFLTDIPPEDILPGKAADISSEEAARGQDVDLPVRPSSYGHALELASGEYLSGRVVDQYIPPPGQRSSAPVGFSDRMTSTVSARPRSREDPPVV